MKNQPSTLHVWDILAVGTNDSRRLHQRLMKVGRTVGTAVHRQALEASLGDGQRRPLRSSPVSRFALLTAAEYCRGAATGCVVKPMRQPHMLLLFRGEEH